jgi:hypothetical protein
MLPRRKKRRKETSEAFFPSFGVFLIPHQSSTIRLRFRKERLGGVAALLGCAREEGESGREKERKREGGGRTDDTGELVNLALGTAEGTELRVARKGKEMKSVRLILSRFLPSSPRERGKEKNAFDSPVAHVHHPSPTCSARS